MASFILDKLTPEQLERLPAGIPPPGEKSNLVNPPSAGNIFYVSVTILMALMYIIAGLRYYTRIFVVRKLRADDWTILVSLIGTTAYFGICLFTISRGKVGTHIWNLSVGHLLRTDNLILSFLLAWFPAPVMAFVKTSFFLMYLQHFHPYKWMRWAIYAGLFVSWSYYVSTFIVNIYITAPAPGQSWQEAPLSTDYMKTSFLRLARTIIVSLVIDVYLFVLPMVAIWTLKIEVNKKYGLALVFATGLLACIASSVSVYYNNLLVVRQGDFTYYAMFVNLMTMIELSVGISAACMPPCSILFKNKKMFGKGGFLSMLIHPKRSNWDGTTNDEETVTSSVAEVETSVEDAEDELEKKEADAESLHIPIQNYDHHFK